MGEIPAGGLWHRQDRPRRPPCQSSLSGCFSLCYFDLMRVDPVNNLVNVVSLPDASRHPVLQRAGRLRHRIDPPVNRVAVQTAPRTSFLITVQSPVFPVRLCQRKPTVPNRGVAPVALDSKYTSLLTFAVLGPKTSTVGGFSAQAAMSKIATPTGILRRAWYTAYVRHRPTCMT